MKDTKKITLEISTEKIEAIQTFNTISDFDISKALNDTIEQIYNDIVPEPVRLYIDRNKVSLEPKKEKDRVRPKRNDKANKHEVKKEPVLEEDSEKAFEQSM